MKRILAPAMALVGLSALSGMAYGQAVVLTSNSYSWGGFYAGVNAGGVFNRTCANWTPYVNGVPVSDYVLNNCPNNSEFTGGAQLGYNFAFDQIVLGLEADYNGWSSKSKTRQDDLHRRDSSARNVHLLREGEPERRWHGASALWLRDEPVVAVRDWRIRLRERIADDGDLLHAGGDYKYGSAEQQDQDSQCKWLDGWRRSRIRRHDELKREGGVPVYAIWPCQQERRWSLHRTGLRLRARNYFHQPQQRRSEHGAAGCQLALRRALKHCRVSGKFAARPARTRRELPIWGCVALSAQSQSQGACGGFIESLTLDRSVIPLRNAREFEPLQYFCAY